MDTMGTVASIIMIVLGFMVLVQLVAITWLFIVIAKIMLAINDRVDPLIAKVNHLLSVVNTLAEKVQDKAEHIAERASDTTDTVTTRVERVSGLMERTVSGSIIQGVSAMEGLRQAVQTWFTRRRDRRQKTACPPDATTEGPVRHTTRRRRMRE